MKPALLSSPNSMKTVYFVRHGESQANVDQLIAGGEFESPLTARGKVQAKTAGKTLKDKNIDVIVSSPMGRTRDTAEFIALELGYDPSKIIIDEDFIEVYNGYYSGKSYAIRDQHIREGRLVKDIEHPDEVHKRVKRGLDRLSKLNGDSIVLVSHGATGRMVRAIAEDLPHHDFMSHKRIGNTEIYKFTLE